LNVYANDPLNLVAQNITVVVADETTAAATIPNSALADDATYYVYLTYGPDSRYQTDAVPLFGGGSSSQSENKANVVGLVVGIIIAVVAVIAVIVVVIVFSVWSHNEIKRRTTESDTERIGMGDAGQFVLLFDFYLFIYVILCSSSRTRIIEDEEEVEVDENMDDRDPKDVSKDEWYSGDRAASASVGSRSTVHVSSEDGSADQPDAF
jgi:hypothetical protein